MNPATIAALFRLLAFMTATPVSQARYFPFIAAVFITTLIVSNIVAVKIAHFGGSLFLPAAVIIFPVGYIISDILTEVYGFAAMRGVIWTGFACNLLAVAVLWLSVQLPPAPFFTGQDAFAQTLGAAPRILFASFIAYLIGEFTNAFILAKLKVKTKGRFLWVRTIGSTIVGEGLDSAIFITIAFTGVFPGMQIVQVALTQWIFKVAFETLATPFTYWIIGWLKRNEGIDHYDTHTNFNPLPFVHAHQ